MRHGRPSYATCSKDRTCSDRRVDWNNRKPLLLLRLSAVFLLRLAERTLAGLLFQEPPRNERRLMPHAPAKYRAI